MSDQPVFVAGDTYPFVVDLTVGGKPFPVEPSGGVVEAVWVRPDGQTAITAVAAQSSTAIGAAWAAGKVAIVFPGVESDKLAAYRQAILEVQVTVAAGKQTWRETYAIVRGVIP